MKRIGIVLGLMLVASPVYSAPKEHYIPVNHSKDADWHKIVGYATRLSLHENPDQSGIERICHPSVGECNISISYTDHKNHSIMQITRIVDIYENTVQRLICKLNLSVDIRKCLVFDTGEKFAKMRNTNGDWEQLNDYDPDKDADFN